MQVSGADITHNSLLRLPYSFVLLIHTWTIAILYYFTVTRCVSLSSLCISLLQDSTVYLLLSSITPDFSTVLEMKVFNTGM